jgi:hypothetical protein
VYCLSSQALTSASGAHLISKCISPSTSGVVLNFPPLAMLNGPREFQNLQSVLGQKPTQQIHVNSAIPHKVSLAHLITLFQIIVYIPMFSEDC